MGSAVSACCSAEPPEKKEFIATGAASTQGAPPGSEAAKRESYGAGEVLSPGGSIKTISDAEVEAFRKRLENSITVTVLLADGTKLTCKLKLDQQSLVISCDTNVRVIQFTELKSILFGKDQLKRVETKANLTNDPNCAALHMNTGNCIPIRFEDTAERAAFCELIRRLKSNK